MYERKRWTSSKQTKSWRKFVDKVRLKIKWDDLTLIREFQVIVDRLKVYLTRVKSRRNGKEVMTCDDC